MPRKSTKNTMDFPKLVESYYLNKTEAESYKAICDEQNKSIKQYMSDVNQTEADTGKYTVKISVQERQTLDEDKLLKILKEDWTKAHGSMQCPYIKTTEYVDMDALEDAIYAGTINQETLVQMDGCRSVKKVTTLKVTPNKED